MVFNLLSVFRSGFSLSVSNSVGLWAQVSMKTTAVCEVICNGRERSQALTVCVLPGPAWIWWRSTVALPVCSYSISQLLGKAQLGVICVCNPPAERWGRGGKNGGVNTPKLTPSFICSVTYTVLVLLWFLVLCEGEAKMDPKKWRR